MGKLYFCFSLEVRENRQHVRTTFAWNGWKRENIRFTQIWSLDYCNRNIGVVLHLDERGELFWRQRRILGPGIFTILLTSATVRNFKTTACVRGSCCDICDTKVCGSVLFFCLFVVVGFCWGLIFLRLRR